MKLQLYWATLPNPIAMVITDSFDWITICNASKVCKEWYKFFSDDALWRKLLITEWPNVSEKHWNNIKEFTDWKRVFYSQRKNRLKKSKLSNITIDKKLLFQRKRKIVDNILATTLPLSKKTDTNDIYSSFPPKYAQKNVDTMKLYESLLVTYGNNSLGTTDLNTMSTKFQSTGTINSFAISSAHKLFAGTNKGIDVWDPISLKKLLQLKLSSDGGCSLLKLDSGKLSYNQEQKDGKHNIHVYDLQANQVICTVPCFKYSEPLIESENILYAETSNGLYQFIDIRTQETVGQVDERSNYQWGSFPGASNGTYFAIGVDTAYDVKIADRRMLGQYIQTYKHTYQIAGLEWIDTSTIASVSWDFNGRIFDVKSGNSNILQFCAKGFSVKKLFNEILVTGHADNCMSLWDLKTKREICSLVCDTDINCWNNLELDFSENYLVGLTQHSLAVYDLSKFGNV